MDRFYFDHSATRAGKSEAQRLWRDAHIAAGHRVLIIGRGGHACEVVPFKALRR